MSQKLEISDSIKAVLNVDSLAGFVIDDDELVLEEPLRCPDWHHGLPGVDVRVGVSALKLVPVGLPAAELRDRTNGVDLLANPSVIVNSEIEVVDGSAI